MAQWADIPFKDALFANADESILRRAPAAAENVYANQAEGFSRFPGLRSLLALPNEGRIYLHEWRDDLIAATERGRVYRIGKDLSVADVTGVPLVGGKRPVFAATEEQLVIATGGPLVSLSTDRTERLSDEAPESTHVAFVDGYLIAIEQNSGRFRFSDPGSYRVWNELSVFSADGKPDNLVAVAVTPYRELLLCGPESIEQFERLSNGARPFARRWSTGEGLAHPYTLVTDLAGTYGVNERSEMTRFNAQVSREQSRAIALALEEVEDWTDAWAASIAIKGQRMVLLQAPRAVSEAHGATGVTFLLDYRASKWSFLWGWDSQNGRPDRWPGWSIASAWGRTFVGVEDGIAEARADEYSVLGKPMRALWRSAHIDSFGPSRMDDLRIRLKRAVGGYQGREPQMMVRVNRDNGKWSDWVFRGLGAPGDTRMVVDFGGFGWAHSWQLEVAITDAVPVEFVSAQARMERGSW
ncbi:hypothetical protein [Falsiroseomonas tokyonensis]|uniref:Phage tail protein n=1 Tax=Falsiroseomonas tokyonensis TaxID=430521 RepID=A0ABV7BXB9_9PROT|nr:hypothetical protein [Falsiroseomonas tokyonensis]MBU8540178.1 hypothetical protein [Falsiroseomonas tokyonensis]